MSLRDDARYVLAMAEMYPVLNDTTRSALRRVSTALLLYLGEETNPEEVAAKAAEMDAWDEFFADPTFRGMLGYTGDSIPNPDHPDNRGE